MDYMERMDSAWTTKLNNYIFSSVLVAANQTIVRYDSWENLQQEITGIVFSISNIYLRTKQISRCQGQRVSISAPLRQLRNKHTAFICAQNNYAQNVLT